MMDSDQLRTAQATIRLDQRQRMDEIHALCHDAMRAEFYRSIGGEADDAAVSIARIHALTHEFMRSMDEAILIHRRIAEIEGRDPATVDGALWPVRTQPPVQGEAND